MRRVDVGDPEDGGRRGGGPVGRSEREPVVGARVHRVRLQRERFCTTGWSS